MKSKKSCIRCFKIKKIIFECSDCDSKLCLECMDDKIYGFKSEFVKENNKILISDKYCYYDCSHDNKYCNDCGKKYMTISRCFGCHISLCYNCKKKNNAKTNDYNLTIDEKCDIINYCNTSCYLIHNKFTSDYSICNMCKNTFLNEFNFKECQVCRQVKLIETDILFNKKRKQLQNRIMKYLGQEYFDKNHLLKFCQKINDRYIKDTGKINENNILFEEWLEDNNSGNHSCMNIWDFSVNKYLGE